MGQQHATGRRTTGRGASTVRMAAGAVAIRVSPGAQYQFVIDYRHLPADPNASKGTGGWVYAPGRPVAVWR